MKNLLKRILSSLERWDVIAFNSHDCQALIAGKAVFQGNLSEAANLILTSRPSKPQLVITPNVDQVNRLVLDTGWYRSFSQADLLLVDGRPVEMLLRILGARGVHRITGADLLPAVCSQAIVHNTRIAIVGGRDEVRESAIRNLTETHGEELDIYGISVPFADNGLAAAAKEASEIGADVVFVCLSSPKQEQWVIENASQLPPGWYVGAGAAVDFAAGAVERAPQWMQNAGMEWVFRLSQEPRRLAHRYLVVGPMFLGIVFTSLLRQGSN